MDQWIFYTDLFGRFQWLRRARDGRQLDESVASFETASACVQDAIRHGLQADAACTCRLPGVIRSPAAEQDPFPCAIH